MKIWMFLLISTVVLLTATPPVNAQNQCGTFLQTVPAQCSAGGVCFGSVNMHFPAGASYIQYVYSPVYCCGELLPSYASMNTFCIWGSLRDPKTQENLRRALFIQDLLIASCDGTYHRFDQLNDGNLPLDPKKLKPRLPLS
jgi:hypothetical protein